MKYVAVLVTLCGASQVLGLREQTLRVPEEIRIPIVARNPIACDPFTLLKIIEGERFSPPTGRTFAFSHPFDPNATYGNDIELKKRHPELATVDAYVCVYCEKETRL